MDVLRTDLTVLEHVGSAQGFNGTNYLLFCVDLFFSLSL